MSKIQTSELKARFSKKSKLPVPAPNHPELSAEPAIPAFLDRKINGIKGPGPVIAVLPVNTKPLTLPEASAKLIEQQKATKKIKARVRIEKLVAKKSGEAAKMPLTGKAALQAIVASSKVPVTKVPAGLTTAQIDRQARKGTPAKAPGKAKGAKNGKSGSKVALIADLLKRKGGCTTADVLKATGWPSVSVPQQAKAAGLKLVKDKKPGEVTRYSAK